MPEGEIDGVRERPVREHNKSARCAVGLSLRRCERTHSDTARGYTQFSMLWYLDTSMDPQDIYECVFLVATPDYEYGGRRIVGNTRHIRNENPVASVRLPRRWRGARASYVVVGGAHRGSSPQNFMSR